MAGDYSVRQPNFIQALNQNFSFTKKKKKLVYMVYVDCREKCS